jgi:hypothetical protein
MKNIAFKFFALVLLAGSFAACKKDYGNQLGPLQDSLAGIPVTVVNPDYFERFPVIVTKVDSTKGPTVSTGAFSITLSIPAGQANIKEITKVAMGNSGVAYLQNSAPNYLAAPIAGNGSNTITFSSDLNAVRDYSKRLAASSFKGTAYTFINQTKRLSQTLTPNPNPQTPNQLRFFFLLTLDDGTTQLISTEVDVRLL